MPEATAPVLENLWKTKLEETCWGPAMVAQLGPRGLFGDGCGDTVCGGSRGHSRGRAKLSQNPRGTPR